MRVKFNKRKLVTYQAKLKLEDNDDLLYGISSQVKEFIEAASQKFDKEGVTSMIYYTCHILIAE